MNISVVSHLWVLFISINGRSCAVYRFYFQFVQRTILDNLVLCCVVKFENILCFDLIVLFSKILLAYEKKYTYN